MMENRFAESRVLPLLLAFGFGVLTMDVASDFQRRRVALSRVEIRHDCAWPEEGGPRTHVAAIPREARHD